AGVQDVLHFRSAGIGQDAAIAQGSWPPLHPSLKPAKHLARRQSVGGPPTQLPLVIDLLDRAVAIAERRPVSIDSTFDLALVEPRTPVGVPHDDLARAARDAVPYRERRSQRRPCVTGG